MYTTACAPVSTDGRKPILTGLEPQPFAMKDSGGDGSGARQPAPPDDVDPQRIERRRRLFRVLRVALPAGTVAIILLALFWPQLIGHNDRIDIATPMAGSDAGKPPDAIVNAAYSGVDREGRPFSIKAKSARNPPGDETALQLMQPDAQIALKDGSLLTIDALQGLYRRDQASLELQGDVTLRRGGDLTVRTEQVTIDLRGPSAAGDRPVGATSTQGTLSGTGFRILAGGDTVFVNGPAWMQVVPGGKMVLP